jgi:hypothetical protein
MNLNSVISCLNAKESFGYYNVFNSELLNTSYLYKTKDFLGILKILKSYRYKYYNLGFLITLFGYRKQPNSSRVLLILIYFLLISYELKAITDYELLSADALLTFFRVCNLVGIFSFFLISILKLITVSYENLYSLTVTEHKRDIFVIGQLYEVIENNPLDIFPADEI